MTTHRIELDGPLGGKAKYWLTCDCGWFHAARNKSAAHIMARSHLGTSTVVILPLTFHAA